MVNENDFQKAVELIKNSNNILITTHTRPDGDACGSMIAVTDTLTTLGKKVKPLLLSEMPEWYKFLFTEEEPSVLGKDITVEQLEQENFDLIIIVDTNSHSQLADLSDFLKQNDKPLLAIDHHITNDGLGSVELVDTSAAATALIVFDFLKFLNWKLNKVIAQALFVAIATDTGWFQFGNTDGRVHRCCAELIDAGANSTKIYQNLYQNVSLQRFKLMVAMLNTLEIHIEGKFAMLHLIQSDFNNTGDSYNDTENLIDEYRKISSAEAAVLMVELPDGNIKCSFRSRGHVDVRKVAEKLGGGGHKRAAGASMPGPLKKVKQQVFDEVKKQFE